MVIYKKPAFEDDSYMFVIDLENDELSDVPFEDVGYFDEKHKAFTDKNICKLPFLKFANRPSFASLDYSEDISGTIYTSTCERKNRLDLDHIIKLCRLNHVKSRRCAINFADTLADYADNTKNTSCLNSIHFHKDNVTVYFRASDIENELLIDLHLIYDFFIKPVGKFKTLTVMSSTAQRVNTNLINLIK